MNSPSNIGRTDARDSMGDSNSGSTGLFGKISRVRTSTSGTGKMHFSSMSMPNIDMSRATSVLSSLPSLTGSTTFSPTTLHKEDPELPECMQLIWKDLQNCRKHIKSVIPMLRTFASQNSSASASETLFGESLSVLGAALGDESFVQSGNAAKNVASYRESLMVDVVMSLIGELESFVRESQDVRDLVTTYKKLRKEWLDAQDKVSAQKLKSSSPQSDVLTKLEEERDNAKKAQKVAYLEASAHIKYHLHRVKTEYREQVRHFLSTYQQYTSCVTFFLAQRDVAPLLDPPDPITLLPLPRPSAKADIARFANMKIYGTKLTDLLEKDKTPIPLFLSQCLQYLELSAIDSEGIYRISPGTRDLQDFKKLIDEGDEIDLFGVSDPNLIAAAVKAMFREMPEPVIPLNLYATFVAIAHSQDTDQQKIAGIRSLITQMPIENATLFRYLLVHLGTIAKNSEINKMPAANLAVVFGPNLLRSPLEAENPMRAALEAPLVVKAIDFCIREQSEIFRGLGIDGGENNNNSGGGGGGGTASRGFSILERPIGPKFFGVPLGEIVKREEKLVPKFVDDCMEYLKDRGVLVEGIFRNTMSMRQLNDLKQRVDHGHDYDLSTIDDPHVVATLLKTFFRDLPTPILPTELYPRLLRVAETCQNPDELLQGIVEAVAGLPAPNRLLLGKLMSLLDLITQHSDINKMTPSNLAILFGPNLLRPADSVSLMKIAYESPLVTKLVETCIMHPTEIFGPTDVV